jgi:hypothetical protein
MSLSMWLPDGSATTDLATDPQKARNVIAGASGKNPGDQPGRADIICWNCEDGKILVWEVKHEASPETRKRDGEEEAQAPGQIQRYVRWLQRAHPGMIVEAGPDFEDELVGVSPTTGGPLYVHSSKAQPKQGVVVYRSEGQDQKVRSEKEQKLDCGAVEEDYASDTIIIGGASIIAAAACIAVTVCLIAVVGVAAGATVGVMTQSQMGLAA